MPNYYKKRRSTKKTSDTFDIDWKLILVGIGLFLVYRLFTSKKGSNKGTLLDWLKSLFNLGFGFGSGNNPLGNSNAGSDYGFENGNGNGANSENGSGNGGGIPPALNQAKYFQEKEYFGNYPRPTAPEHIANYNRLIKSLDVIRAEFGSAVVIKQGYNSNDERLAYRVCKGVVISAQNGRNTELYDLIAKLKLANKIETGTVYIFEKETIQYIIN